jgi:hypothetical protein
MQRHALYRIDEALHGLSVIETSTKVDDGYKPVKPFSVHTRGALDTRARLLPVLVVRDTQDNPVIDAYFDPEKGNESEAAAFLLDLANAAFD